jgi:hypothetical protein
VAKDSLPYPDALQGRAVPRGGPASPAEHNEGNTDSEFTSWITDPQVAREKALDKDIGGRGVVLEKDFDAARLVRSPDAYFESEVLIRGLVTVARVTEVP